MTDDEILQHAGAFVILHGGPPKGLKWRGAGFEKRGSRAQAYCFILDGYLRTQYPGQLGDKPKKAVIWRNKVLREILSIPQRRK
jgi:hypothetical protein